MSLFTSLYWREPLWLLLILLPVVLSLFQRRRLLHLRRQMMDERLKPWVESKASTAAELRLKAPFIAAWLLLAVALSGPRTALLIPPALQGPMGELIFITDLSGSMEAQDTELNQRPQARRDAATRLAQKWNDEIGERLEIGLTVFAGDPHHLLLPSSDTSLRAHFLEQLVALQAPTLGNNLSAALVRAAQALSSETEVNYLVLFTDGDIEPEQRRSTVQTLENLLSDRAELSLKIIGIGGTEAIRLKDGNTTRLEYAWLRQLAEHPRVEYLNLLQADQTDLSQLLDLPTARIAPDQQDEVIWNEWFPLPLMLAIGALLLGFWVAGRSGGDYA